MKLDANKRQRFLIIAVVAGLALLLLDSLVFTPLTKSWAARDAEIAKLKKDVANGRGVIERGPRTQSLWAEMQTNALPKDQAQAEQDLITALDRWGRQAGIDVSSIKPQWKKGTGDRFSMLECRIDASGSITSLTRFLHEVEKSPMALRVDSIELGTRDNSGSRLNLALLVSGLRLSPLERKS